MQSMAVQVGSTTAQLSDVQTRGDQYTTLTTVQLLAIPMQTEIRVPYSQLRTSPTPLFIP